MTKQERASRVLAILLQFSSFILKPKNLKKLKHDDKAFLYKMSQKRYVSISPREYTMLEALKEKYL